MGIWMQSKAIHALLEEFEDVKYDFIRQAIEEGNKEDVAFWYRFTFLQYVECLVDCENIKRVSESWQYKHHLEEKGVLTNRRLSEESE